MSIAITIDGTEFKAQPGETVLEVARRAGIWIPALCYHPAVSAYGACRLCLVEVEVRGRRRLVTSCCYPAGDGLQVLTNTEKVRAAQRGVMRLLLARAPDSAVLRNLARALGVSGPPLPTVTRAEGDCILCGLCVNVCREVIGAAAISFAGRGVDRKVSPPFAQPSPDCLGCGACAAVCPVGAITLEPHDAEIEVVPLRNRVSLIRCRECGQPIAGQPFLELIRQRLADKSALISDLCDSCKRRATARLQRGGRAAAHVGDHLLGGVLNK